MGRPVKNKNSYYFRKKNSINNVENLEPETQNESFLNDVQINIEEPENPIFENPPTTEQNEEQEQKQKINDFKIPEFQHPYLFGLEIANTLINKYFKKDVSFSDTEKKELSKKMWVAFPTIPEISPKIDLFLTLGLLYANKLNVL